MAVPNPTTTTIAATTIIGLLTIDSPALECPPHSRAIP